MFDRTSQNKALMRRVYEEMWNQGRASIASELFARPDGVERFVSQFLASFPDLQHSIEGMIAEDDRVAVSFAARGTHQGQWLHLDATGVPIQYTGVTWARIEGDKIIEHHTCWDKAGLMEQIAGGKM